MDSRNARSAAGRSAAFDTASSVLVALSTASGSSASAQANCLVKVWKVMSRPQARQGILEPLNGGIAGGVYPQKTLRA